VKEIKDIAEILEPNYLAQLFHDSYELLAPQYGYETRKDSAVKWSEVPEKNKKLMIHTATVVSDMLAHQIMRYIKETYREKN
jgi:hypothetical protein